MKAHGVTPNWWENVGQPPSVLGLDECEGYGTDIYFIMQKQGWYPSMKQGPNYAALTLRGPRNLVPVKGD